MFATYLRLFITIILINKDRDMKSYSRHLRTQFNQDKLIFNLKLDESYIYRLLGN